MCDRIDIQVIKKTVAAFSKVSPLGMRPNLEKLQESKPVKQKLK